MQEWRRGTGEDAQRNNTHARAQTWTSRNTHEDNQAQKTPEGGKGKQAESTRKKEKRMEETTN
jgi:hypothetical protein